MLNLIKRFFEWDGLFPSEKGFVQTALLAAPYILSALGGIFGKKKKYMDPEEYQRKYGPHALADETQQIANFILNSPYGQSLLTSAAQGGQQFQNDIAAKSAASGTGAGADATSGTNIFATAGSGQAQNNLERGVKSDITKMAIPIAAENVAGYGSLALKNLAERNNEPSVFQKLAAAAGQYGGTAPNVRPTTVAAPGEEDRQQALIKMLGGMA